MALHAYNENTGNYNGLMKDSSGSCGLMVTPTVLYGTLPNSKRGFHDSYLWYNAEGSPFS